MLSRHLTMAIVAFWATTTGWFFSRDLWPRYFADDRPPFSVNLAEEAKSPPLAQWVTWHEKGKVTNLSHATTHWNLFINQETAGEVLTLVQEDEDGTYEVFTNQRFTQMRGLLRLIPFGDTMKAEALVETRTHVTAEGELLETESHSYLTLTQPQRLSFEVHVTGKVEDGHFVAASEVRTSEGARLFELKGEPVEVRSSHGLFDPTHPWSRLYDLQEDRTWRVAYFNPTFHSLLQSFSSLAPGLGQRLEVPILEGGVRSGQEEETWDGRQTPARRIEYHNEDKTINGVTLVRKSDGLVIDQRIKHEPLKLEIALTRKVQ